MTEGTKARRSRSTPPRQAGPVRTVVPRETSLVNRTKVVKDMMF